MGAVGRSEPAAGRGSSGRGGGRRTPSTDAAERNRKGIYGKFLFPALLLYTAVVILPSLAGAVISFGRWRGPGDRFRWAGLDNYRRLFGDDAFRTAFDNTAILLVAGGVGVFTLTFLLMVVLREMRGQAFLRSVLFLPAVVSTIAVGTAIGFFLDPNGGLNSFLGTIGAGGLTHVWLGPDLIFPMILIGFVWLSTGFYVVLFMSAVDGIPPYLYEDARLVGATRLQQFWHITLPLTWDIFSIAAILWVINGLRVFDIVIAFVGTTGSPPVEARTIAFEQYLIVTQAGELGYGAAMGIAILLLTVVLILLIRRLTRRESVELS